MSQNSESLERVKQKEIQKVIFNSDFPSVIWSDLQLSDLEPEKSSPNSHFQESKGDESVSNNQYYKHENEHCVINQINFINNQVINNTIPVIESEIIDSCDEGNNQESVKQADRKSTDFAKKRKQKRSVLMMKLHDDLYEDQPLMINVISNRFFQVTTFITGVMVLTALNLPSKQSLLSQNQPLVNYNFTNPPLKQEQDVLEFNNLAQIPVKSEEKSDQSMPQPTLINQPPIPLPVTAEKTENLTQNHGNFQNQVIVDRYYIPQNNQQNPNENVNQGHKMMVVDRYYLPQNENMINQPETTVVNQNEVKPKINQASGGFEQMIPPPPPLEIHSSIPTINSVNHNEQNLSPSAFGITQNQNNTYTLQGVINFGENSAALFNTGETTVRINQGELMNNDGWILVKIEDGQAILSKNGENVTLRVGESINLTLN